MKTLVIILHHNTPEITLPLFDSLRKYERNDYVTYILDNGSDTDKSFHFDKCIKLPTNIYFGGGLNYAFKILLNNNDFDSLLFMNSDLIIHPYNFVSTIREYLGMYKIISPSIIEPNYSQCHWKQMHQYQSQNIRNVKWIDFQCPMFSKEFIQHIDQFDNELRYGWGNDVYSGIICEEQNWKIGVLDTVTAIHLNGYTTNKFKQTNEISGYNRNAETNMFAYFGRINQVNKLLEFRKWAEHYAY